MAKEKMSAEKKTKLIYCGELILIAIVFIVIATLDITRVLHIRDWVLIAFNWVTLFGGLWIIADFVWTLVSPKKRAKNSLLDKALMLPVGVFFIVFDLYCLINQLGKTDVSYDFRLYMMVSAFYYIAAIYIFQGIYHYKYPIPMLVAAIKEAEEDETKKLAQIEETKTSEETPEVIESKTEKERKD